ncbi:SDR family oxidoreductase [Streptomyces venezuelae]|nr:SDR family oxidoreductase [Streptomyces venezuelae]
MIDRCAGLPEARSLTLRQICRSVCRPGPSRITRGAARAGPAAFVRSAAVQRGPRGVRVNAVAPGVVRTRGPFPYPTIGGDQ